MAPDTSQASISKGPLPPYRCISNFLTDNERNDLLQFSIACEAHFKPTGVRHRGIEVLNPQQRVSVRLREFGPAQNMLRARIIPLIPKLISELRVSLFALAKIEMELVAHGQGAFFKRHIDTLTGVDAKGKSSRLLSAVYYFHSEPKGFEGGALRLYRFGRVENADDFVDIQPMQNTLVAFPSWASHEVLPVTCPSGRFSDSRFAVNFWVHAAPHSPLVP
jgi:Rps23 Pro-64 3,4-dihydroxylase Tpa1-like proline 4-hydroxylase